MEHGLAIVTGIAVPIMLFTVGLLARSISNMRKCIMDLKVAHEAQSVENHEKFVNWGAHKDMREHLEQRLATIETGLREVRDGVVSLTTLVRSNGR